MGNNREIRQLQNKMAMGQGNSQRQMQRMEFLQQQQGGPRNAQRQARRDDFLARKEQRGAASIAKALGAPADNTVRRQMPNNNVFQGRPRDMMDGMQQGGMDGQAMLRTAERRLGGQQQQQQSFGDGLTDYKAGFKQDELQSGELKSRNDSGFAKEMMGPGGGQNQGPMQRPTPGNMQQGGNFNPMQRPTPGNMQQGGNFNPMQRPTPGNMEQGGNFNPMQRPTPGGQQQMGGSGLEEKFNRPGYQPPMRPPLAGNQLGGGGTNMDKFSRPGYSGQGAPVTGSGLQPNRATGYRNNKSFRPGMGILAPPPRR